MYLLRKILIFPLLIISSSIHCATFYVATNGNDDNPGTFARPWRTWSMAFNSALPGDTVFFRGGTYPNSGGHAGEVVHNSGTFNNWICFFNYPGEEPILDCSNKTISQTNYIRAMTVWDVSYIHFKGLCITKAAQVPYGGGYTFTSGLSLEKCHHIILENMKFSYIAGPAVTIGGCNEVYFKNCDAWELCDNRASNPGQGGVGFEWNNSVAEFGEAVYNYRIYFEGCRTWNFSDNGFAGVGVAYVELKNCWAFNGGALTGEGCGFKYNNESFGNTRNPLTMLIKNCIAANNGFYGFSPNNNGGTVFNGHYFNNFAYHNGYKHDLLWWRDYFGVGFVIFNYLSSSPAPNELYANNISFGNEYMEVVAGDLYTHHHNSWDLPVNVTNADFLSLDWTELLKPRKSDGSLPDINFGKLASGSDLIDAGYFVGIPYFGTAPDLGWFETSDGSVVPAPPVYLSSSVEDNAPDKIEIIYNIELAGTAPNPSAFSVLVNSVSRQVTSVSVTGTKVILTLANPVAFGDIVVIGYTVPSLNPIQSISGQKASSFTSVKVDNKIKPPLPVYISSVIEDATPDKLEITFSQTLANSVPSSGAFTVKVNSSARTVRSVSVSGNKVVLVLSSPVVYGNIITVAYTKPAVNPVKTLHGAEADSFTAQRVRNNVKYVNSPPAVIINYSSSCFSGFIGILDASDSYDIDHDNLAFQWIVPENIPVSSTSSQIISFLSPFSAKSQSFTFTLKINDSKAIQEKSVSIEIIPYKLSLPIAKVSKIEASSYSNRDSPANVLDEDFETIWSSEGDNQWLLLYFNEPYYLDHIKIAFKKDQNFSSYFEVIGIREDATEETILDRSTSCSFSGNLQVFPFHSSTAGTAYSAIKLIGHGNSVNSWNYFSELKLFGFPESDNLEHNISIYPSPIKDYLNISIAEPAQIPEFIRILNLFGQTVYESKMDPGIRELRMPLNLIDGVYIINMHSGGITQFTQKLIICN